MTGVSSCKTRPMNTALAAQAPDYLWALSSPSGHTSTGIGWSPINIQTACSVLPATILLESSRRHFKVSVVTFRVVSVQLLEKMNTEISAKF